jgi:hypothetical protein
MPAKKLDARIFSTWSTYAGSMFGILTNCGMWDFGKDSYGTFLGMTGIAFQLTIDDKCSAASVTAYNWEKENNGFLNRLGVTTDICYSFSHYHNFDEGCRIAVREMKESIDAGRGVVLWGVDTGEFGVVYGYDDEDEVFFVSGIGSNDSKESNPILYQNIGKTFGSCLYCHYPLSYQTIPINERIRHSLQFFVEHMTEKPYDKDSASYCGLSAYKAWINALDSGYDPFGVRYVTGMYTERKNQGAGYFEWISTVIDIPALKDLANTYQGIARLFNTMHFDILCQTFSGWDCLNNPVSDSMAADMKRTLAEIFVKEEQAILLAGEALKDL